MLNNIEWTFPESWKNPESGDRENVSIWWRHHGNECSSLPVYFHKFWRMSGFEMDIVYGQYFPLYILANIAYGSGHETAAVLLPGFAINW